MIDELQIFPPPSPDEAAAIAAALERLFAQREASAQSASRAAVLRYRDVASRDLQRRLGWNDMARLEELNIQAQAIDV